MSVDSIEEYRASGGVPKIAVLLVNFHSYEHVEGCVRDLLAHADGAEIKLSIVDNSCSPDEQASLRSLASRAAQPAFKIQVTAPDENLGYGRGLNAAWDALQDVADVVVLMNPDVRIQSGSLARLAREVAGSRSLWSAPTHSGGSLLSGQATMNRWTSATRQIRLGEHAARGLVYPSGHFLVLPQNLWVQLGGMSNALFLYCEEIDLMLRASKVGARCLARSGAVELQHIGGSTTTAPDGSLSDVPTYHATRSRILLYRTHPTLRWYMPTMMLARMVLAGRLAMSGRRRSARMVAIAIRDGLAGAVM